MRALLILALALAASNATSQDDEELFCRVETRGDTKTIEAGANHQHLRATLSAPNAAIGCGNFIGGDFESFTEPKAVGSVFSPVGGFRVAWWLYGCKDKADAETDLMVLATPAPPWNNTNPVFSVSVLQATIGTR